jgi:hypothetical protein
MKRNDTLAFSIIAYSSIVVMAFLYVQWKAGFGALLFMTDDNHPSLSGSEFNFATIILLIGIGTLVCLLILAGVAAYRNGVFGASTIFGFIGRTMQVSGRRQETIGELLFSDYQNRPGGIADAARLQASAFARALIKTVTLIFYVGSLPFLLVSVFAVLLFFPNFLLGHTAPVIWYAVTYSFLFIFCYRAFLLQTAKRRGISRRGDLLEPVRIGGGPFIEAYIRSAATDGVAYDFLLRILGQESVVNVIRTDWKKTGQIGYQEVWRLGLITPDQDIFDSNPSPTNRREGIQRIIRDNNYRLNRMEQIPLKRTAVLFNTTVVGGQLNKLVVTGGAIKPMIGQFPGWTYPVAMDWERGEFFGLRDIQMDPVSPSMENRSLHLADFLREDGFPLKASYPDGDPLTTDRGGIIVIEKKELVVIYPNYFIQRRLIDDEGSLVDLGLDECYDSDPMFAVKMRPSVSELLYRQVSTSGSIPVLRYRSVPYESEFLFPILDTPMSADGWADLYIDPKGKAMLFIAKPNTLDGWREMLNRLRELFLGELAKKDNHLLAFHKNKAHLHNYLMQKLLILREYYTIRDWHMF